MKKIFLAFLLLPLFAPKAEAIQFPIVEGFTIDKKIDYFDANTLFNQINGAAAVYLDYGFVEMFHAVYHNASGDGYIVAEAYRHGNPDQAYGMYVSERMGSNDFVDIGAQGYVEEGLLNASGGDWYIKIFSHRKDAVTFAAMKAIASGLEKELFPDAVIPAETTWFPSEGRVEQSDMYVPKEVLGHTFLTEAYTSSYGNYDLFLFKKKSAEELDGMIKAYCEWSGSDCGNIEGLVTVKDRYNGTAYFLSEKNYGAMAVGIEDPEKATAMLKALLSRLR